MVVGIVSLVFCAVPFVGIIGGIVAVVLGLVALKKAQSKGMSVTGIVTGGLALVASIAIFVASLALIGSASNLASAALDELDQKTQPTSEPKETAEPAPEPESASDPEPAAEAQWTTITTLTGTADQQSDTIVLSGGKVRVTYEFTDTSGYGTIVGAIYVLTEGTDLMTDGGIPDVMTSTAGAGETILRKSAGEYYVRVTSANASYTVTVEEQK